MFTLLAAMAIVSASQPSQRFLVPAFEAAVQKDIVYKKAKDYSGKELSLELDVYSPKGDSESARPAVIWVHGGALMFGSKDSPGLEMQFCENLAKLGYVAVNIDYRLRPDPNPVFNDAMRDAMEDVQSALGWLRQNAKKQKVDPSRIGLAGYSAGAEIITNLCYTKFVPTMDRTQVKALVDFAGNTLFWGDPEKGSPPCLIVHGTKDDINPFSASENLKARLDKAQVPNELFSVKDGDHYFNRSQANIALIQEAVVKFLFTHLVKK
jgi:acetyl esterase/lipase